MAQKRMILEDGPAIRRELALLPSLHGSLTGGAIPLEVTDSQSVTEQVKEQMPDLIFHS